MVLQLFCYPEMIYNPYMAINVAYILADSHGTWAIRTNLRCLYSLRSQTSYRLISWNFEAARLNVIMIVSLLNLSGILAAQLPMCLSNFRAIKTFKSESCGFESSRDLVARSTSVHSVNRGPNQVHIGIWIIADSVRFVIWKWKQKSTDVWQNGPGSKVFWQKIFWLLCVVFANVTLLFIAENTKRI